MADLTFSSFVRYPSVHLFRMCREEIDSEPWHYSFAETPLGEILLASTFRGICYLGFTDNHRLEAMNDLKSRFLHVMFREGQDEHQQRILQMWNGEQILDKGMKTFTIPLCLKATDFQWKVWNELMKIPIGTTVTYKDVASAIHASGAYRAVGTAIGANPIAMLIPCHRVLRVDGGWGGYRWGISRKKRLLEWENSFVLLKK